MENKFFRGTVTNSRSDCRRHDRKITLIHVVEVSGKEKFPSKSFQINGLHRIDRGEIIEIEYETNSGNNWVKQYSIVDNHKVKYRSICE